MGGINVSELIDKFKEYKMLRVLSNHEWAWLAHQCTFGEKYARVSMFSVIEIILQVQICIDIVEFE